jgi:hypothetical protein
MTQNSLLSLAEIVRRTGIDQHVLNRYVKLPENRAALMGASTHPQYPMEALPLFFRLAQEHSVKAVTPQTLAGRWKLDNVTPDSAQDTAEIAERTALTPAQSATLDSRSAVQTATICGNGTAESNLRTAKSEGIAVVGPALLLLERFVGVQESRWEEEREVFDANGAAAFLCCSVRLLRRNVPSSFRLGRSSEGDRWYRRDLLGLKGGK